MRVFALQGSMENRSDKAGPAGSGVSLDLMFTLNTADRHSVAITASDSSRITDAVPPATESATAQSVKECANAGGRAMQSVSVAVEQLSMFSLEEPPAKPSASQALEKALLTRGATSHSRILPSLHAIAPSGWSGKTSPASFPTAQALSEPSSVDWQSSGMGGPTEFLTLNTSAWHSGGAACSLSEVLEAGPVPQRFFLSARACSGILRRAGNRGKDLPPPLRHALEAVAGSEPTSTSTED